MEAYIVFMDWKNYHHQNGHTTQRIFRFNAIPIKIPMTYLTDVEQTFQKFDGSKKTLKDCSNFEKEEQSRRDQNI